MSHYYVYVFDSSTANEAASAIEKGQVESIIQYHSNKHNHKQHPSATMAGPQQQQINNQNIMQQTNHNMMVGPISNYPPSHHVSPPNNMQRISGPPPPGSNMPHSQLYDANLSPQKMKEREGHLNKLGQLAQLTTPAPNMPMTIQPRPIQAQHQAISNQQLASQQEQQQQGPLPAQQSQQQQPPPQPRQLAIKTDPMQQPLDPISSMEAMNQNVISDNFTIHHHPQS